MSSCAILRNFGRPTWPVNWFACRPGTEWCWCFLPAWMRRCVAHRKSAANYENIRRCRLLLWLSAVLLFLLFATVGSWIWTRRVALTTAYKVSAAGIGEKSIAVLPFENLSAEKENAFFADGVQNEILTNLARIADLKVISRASVMVYKVG